MVVSKTEIVQRRQEKQEHAKHERERKYQEKLNKAVKLIEGEIDRSLEEEGKFGDCIKKHLPDDYNRDNPYVRSMEIAEALELKYRDAGWKTSRFECCLSDYYDCLVIE